MAREKQEADWLRVGVLAASIMGCWSKDAIDPLKIIPPVFRPKMKKPPPKTPLQIEKESKRAWKLLARAWGKRRKKEWQVSVVRARAGAEQSEPGAPTSKPSSTPPNSTGD